MWKVGGTRQTHVFGSRSYRSRVPTSLPSDYRNAPLDLEHGEERVCVARVGHSTAFFRRINKSRIAFLCELPLISFPRYTTFLQHRSILPVAQIRLFIRFE